LALSFSASFFGCSGILSQAIGDLILERAVHCYYLDDSLSGTADNLVDTSSCSTIPVWLAL